MIGSTISPSVISKVPPKLTDIFVFGGIVVFLNITSVKLFTVYWWITETEFSHALIKHIEYSVKTELKQCTQLTASPRNKSEFSWHSLAMTTVSPLYSVCVV